MVDLDGATQHLIGNYKPQPVVFERGEGCTLIDVQGKRYLDMTAGIAVCALGHAHPRLADTIAAQARRLLHVSNLYYNEPQLRLASALSAEFERASSHHGRLFFCNSGAEANEAALKLARRWQGVVAQQPERTEVIAAVGSFHGRTFGALSMTGQEKYRAGFGPLVEGVRFVPFGDLGAIEGLVGPRTCAVIVEPIQAEGGVVVPPAGYLEALRELCTRHGVVLMFDEVQTGVGRTGTFFAFEQEGASPDIVTLAKALGGGVPLGAIIATDSLARGFEPGTHASTFGGNPLACAAALTVLEVLQQEQLLQQVRATGEQLRRRLEEIRGLVPLAVEVRGRGLLRGLRLDVLSATAADDMARVVARAREAGLLLSIAGGTVLRFVPPLIVQPADIDRAAELLLAVLRA
jgi:predicted acetylornithine/succinylornithine family transaminase